MVLSGRTAEIVVGKNYAIVNGVYKWSSEQRCKSCTLEDGSLGYTWNWVDEAVSP